MATKSEAEFLIFVTSRKLGQIGFTEVSGGDMTRSVEEYPDAEQDESGYIAGTAKYTPLDLGVPYDPKKHDKFLSDLKSFCTNEGDDIQVVIQPIVVCPDQTPDGKARVYSMCTPSDVKFPTVKRGTSGVSMMRCTLNPKRMNFR